MLWLCPDAPIVESSECSLRRRQTAIKTTTILQVVLSRISSRRKPPSMKVASFNLPMCSPESCWHFKTVRMNETFGAKGCDQYPTQSGHCRGRRHSFPRGGKRAISARGTLSSKSLLLRVIFPSADTRRPEATPEGGGWWRRNASGTSST